MHAHPVERPLTLHGRVVELVEQSGHKVMKLALEPLDLTLEVPAALRDLTLGDRLLLQAHLDVEHVGTDLSPGPDAAGTTQPHRRMP